MAQFVQFIFPALAVLQKEDAHRHFIYPEVRVLNLGHVLPLTRVSLSLLAFSLAPASPAPLSPLLAALPLHTKEGTGSSSCAVF